jgi:hypothetical protein
MSKVEFFVTDRAIKALNDAAYNATNPANSDLVRLTGGIIELMSANGFQFDEKCQINIVNLRGKFLEVLQDFRPPYKSDNVELLASYLYRIITEYNLSSAEQMSPDISTFMNLVESHLSEMNIEAKKHVDFAQRGMAVTILKRLFNTDEFQNFANIKEVSTKVSKDIAEWTEKLTIQQQDAERLSQLFVKHANDFNFSGLHAGFSDMSERIKNELLTAQIGIGFFGLLLLAPVSLEIYFAITAFKELITVPVHLIIALALGTLTVTLLFLYFFRIALRKADSCRAQLMQIHLRMSLCRFIQPYTDYSKDIRDKHSDTFAKFESLIFSGIVGTTEKLPSTFDGLEQISALVNLV